MMDTQIYPASANSLPQVVVTEPSPVSVPTESVESIVRKIESIAEVAGNGAPSESTKLVEQASTTPGPSSTPSSEEFVIAIECDKCSGSVPEEQPAQQLEESSTATPEPEQDNFRTPDVECCTLCGIQCIQYYERAWQIVHSKYALPFWMLLMALPISGGYIGAFYMYSCPASHSLPMLKFILGISLMAVISFRICLIIRRMTTTEEDEWGNMLHTLLLISSFLTIVFFITESMAFWRMEPTTDHGAQYCDPHFVTCSFWWNCIMCGGMVPIFLFPA